MEAQKLATTTCRNGKHLNFNERWNIPKFTRKRIEEITQWINNYPRRILDYMTPAELFTSLTNA